MRNVKGIIALDLDGTLLTSNKELTERSRRALEMADAAGYEIVPTTGRFYDAMPQVIRELPFVRYAITINGAQVREVASGQVIYKAEIPYGRALEIMAFLDTLDVVYDCFMGDAAYMTRAQQERIEHYTDNPHYCKMVRQLRHGVDELKEFLSQRKEDVQKSQFFTMDGALRARMLRELPEMFPHIIATSALTHNVEINDERATKGLALLALAEHLGLTAQDTIAFGDGLNDLSMLTAAGRGYAMANACDEVKAATGYTTLSCDEDGVAHAIESILTKEG